MAKKRRGSGEGSIFQRKDGRWVGVITVGYENGKRLRKTYYGDSRKAARDQMTGDLAKQQQGITIPTGRKTLGEFLDQWLEDSVKPVRSPKTYISYAEQVRLHIKPAIGHVLLRKLTGPQVQRFLNSLADTDSKNVKGQKLSARTVAYNRTILRMALKQAVEWRLIPHNPAADGIKTAKVERRRVEAVTVEQAQAILKAVAAHRLSALFVLYLFTGLRRGEALGLRWQDVDLDGRKLRVKGQLQRINKQLVLSEKPKTDHSRRVLTIPQPAVTALREHRARQLEDRMRLGPDWTDTGLVFATELGTPLEPRNIKRALDKLLENAQLPHCRIHDLRHACATLLIQAGEDLKTTSEILGHSSIKVTADVYVHISEAAKERAADRLGALVEAK